MPPRDLDTTTTGPGDTLDRIQRADLYRTQITVQVHPPEVEAVVAVACEDRVAQNDAYVKYLSGKGKKQPGRPGYENQSPTWREKEAAAFASVRALAAVLNVFYPTTTGHLPIGEAKDLVENRTGPLCTGWTDNNGNLTHHTNDSCPVHETGDSTE